MMSLEDVLKSCLLSDDVPAGSFKIVFYAKVCILPPHNYLLCKCQQNIGLIHDTEEGFNY